MLKKVAMTTITVKGLTFICFLSRTALNTYIGMHAILLSTVVFAGSSKQILNELPHKNSEQQCILQ